MVTPPGEDDAAARLETTEAGLLALLRTLLVELNRPPAVLDLDRSLERDLALDSLARVELGLRIERSFGRALPEQALFDAETPRDLLRAVLKASGSAPLRTLRSMVAPAAAADVALPAAAVTLVDMLDWHVAHHPDRAHIHFYDDYTEGEVLSYGALAAGAAAVAGALQARGLAPGERVALMLPTGKDYFRAFYGVLMAGGVPVPIYPPVRRAQLEDHLRRQGRILANCRASFLLVQADEVAVARLLTASVDSLRGVLAVEVLAAAGHVAERCMRGADDLAFLQYTSGSTGDPKGVMLSHANLLANIRADGRGLAATPADVFVSWLPLYHDMGLIGAWLGSLYHAVRFVVMPPLAFMARPQRWLWALHRHGGSLSAAPNFAYELCLTRIPDAELEGLDLGRWRAALNGAEAISAATLEAFCTRFARYGFRRESMMPVYGLAECAVGLAFTPLGRGPRVDTIDRAALATSGQARPLAADAPGVREVVACGLPLTGHELRVVDERDRELPDRREGRVQFRGPSATRGYYDNPQASAELLRDGWLESGDRGYLVAGELHLTGRSKDIIIRAGRNLYPTELEEAVGELDGVRRGHVAVFGTLDAAAGTERLVVLAETRKRDDAGRATLVERINALAIDLLGAPADEVVLASPNTVLRTSSGKIRRRACRALYEAGALARTDRPLWLQLARLALAGVGPQARRALRAAGDAAWAAWAWCLLGVLGIATGLLCWLPLPRAWSWQVARNAARLLAVLTATPVTRHGLDALPPPGTAALVIANHQSYLDGIVLYGVLPRRARFLVKAELGRSALLGRPLRQLGALFVERFDAGAGVAGLDEAAGALAAGECLVVFPEGTFKRMPGLLPFRLGAFQLAVRQAVAPLPLALAGTRTMLRAGNWRPRRGAISVTLGAAIPLPPGSDPWTRALALAGAVRSFILAHAGEPDLGHESNRVEPD